MIDLGGASSLTPKGWTLPESVTVGYGPPLGEVFAGPKYDVFSLGVIGGELVYATFGADNCSPERIPDLDYELSGPLGPLNVSSVLLNILSRAISPDPLLRPTAQELANVLGELASCFEVTQSEELPPPVLPQDPEGREMEEEKEEMEMEEGSMFRPRGCTLSRPLSPLLTGLRR